MKHIVFAAFLSVLLVSGGCATTAPQTKAVQRLPAPAASGSLTSRVLYKLLVGEVAAQRGQMDVAIRNYRDVALETREPRLLRRATQFAASAQALPEALELARLWAAEAPADPEARQVLASLLLSAGRAEEAQAEFKTLLQAGKVDYMQVASLLARQPNPADALGVMESLSALAPQDPMAQFAYAHLAARAGKFDLALQAVDRALALKPDWPDAVMLRARVLLMDKRRDEALSYLDGALKGPLAGNVEIRLGYARLLMEADRLQDAYTQFALIAKQKPEDEDVQYALGLVALDLRRLEDAERHLTPLAETGHHRADAAYHLGLLNEMRRDFPGALKWYEAATGGQYDFPARLKTAALLAQTGKADAALTQLAAISPEGTEEELQVRLATGEVLFRVKRYPEAMTYFDQALEEYPGNTALLYSRALTAEKLDRLDAVERDLNTILAKEPDNAQALNALGYTLADRTTRYDEALKYLERALALRANDPAIIDSMGWLRYRQGDYPGALAHLRRALEMTKDPEIAAHLGEVLWVSGKQDEARQVWDAATKTDPDNEILANTRRRFEK